jgi:hypothetical protein
MLGIFHADTYLHSNYKVIISKFKLDMISTIPSFLVIKCGKKATKEDLSRSEFGWKRECESYENASKNKIGSGLLC